MKTNDSELQKSLHFPCGMIIRELEMAVGLMRTLTYPPLIPEGGISLAYARAGARTLGDVGAVTEDHIICPADLPACRMVLTALRFDPKIRCALVLRYNEKFIAAGDAMLLEICSFNRAQEPPGDTTHDWGTAFCCENSDGVPDIIYDTGCAGKEPLIRMFGENPTQVLASINRILTRIIDTNFNEE